MSIATSIGRLGKLISVVHKYRLNELLDQSLLRLGISCLGYSLNPFARRCKNDMPMGERLCLALTELGPIYIKFGQLLSTRRDLLPPEISSALAKLQDDVEPFCGEQAKTIVTQALEEPLEAHFKTFNTTPMASASIAQVHAGTLHNGDEIIIKVLRPNIRDIIDRDLTLLSLIANWLHNNVPQSKRFKPREVVADYKHTILNELSLLREAQNAQKLAALWADSNLLYVPSVYMPLCREKVLVMERIRGVPISDLEQLHAANTNMQILAERGVEIFFTQVFRDSFFHADMHPGNIFVDISNPQDPRYMAVDFGIMGTLYAEDQRYLAENFLAFFNRDYYQVAKLHVDSGWVPAGTSVEEFEIAIESVCEPIFGKPLSEISFGQLLINLFQTAQKFNMPVQPQLVLLQKTLLYIEGLGRQLYPQLDLWKTAKPYLENWLQERMSLKTLIKEIQNKAPYWREKFPEIPDLIYQTLKSESKNHQLLQQQTDLLEQQLKNQKNQSRAIIYSILGACLLISATLVYLDNNAWNSGVTILSVVGVLAFFNSRRIAHQR